MGKHRDYDYVLRQLFYMDVSKREVVVTGEYLVSLGAGKGTILLLSQRAKTD